MKSNNATNICKICFKDIKEPSFFSFLFSGFPLCRSCMKELKPIWFKWKEGSINFMALYWYDDFFKNVLYRFKGCGDIELSNVFLGPYSWIFRLLYRDYCIVPVPSPASRNEARGYNQVLEMCRCLGLPILECLVKNNDSKQSSLSRSERKEVYKFLSWKKGSSVKGKKILLVDDVFTTGSTARACIRLLKKHSPKKIRVLIVAKVKQSPS